MKNSDRIPSGFNMPRMVQESEDAMRRQLNNCIMAYVAYVNACAQRDDTPVQYAEFIMEWVRDKGWSDEFKRKAPFLWLRAGDDEMYVRNARRM